MYKAQSRIDENLQQITTIVADELERSTIFR
jgi:hypothetical protein